MPRLNIQFRHQPSEKSRYAPVINYYNQADCDLEVPKSDFVMNPLEAYWLPFAVEWSGATPEDIQKALARSVYLLQNHIAYLQSRFEASTYSPPPAPPISTTPPTPVSLHSVPKEEPDGIYEEDEIDIDQDFSDEDSLLDSLI